MFRRLRLITTAAALCLAFQCTQADSADLAAVLLPQPKPLAKTLDPYIRVSGARVALSHVRLIDGTGREELTDQTILIENGKIVAITSSDPGVAGATLVDLTGYTVIPGIVGMHDHLFYIARPNLDASGHSDPPLVLPPMVYSAPRLYLANGVTTLRTTGSVEPYADLNIKRLIDGGQLPGPHMDVTGPYLEGAKSPFIEMHQLKDADDARRTVEFWAAQGVTSFKAYMNISRAELNAATEEAHRLGMKITGHLCSVTYPEAAALGIDNLEHGFFVNTQLDPGKTADLCPATQGRPTLLAMTSSSPEATHLMQELIAHRVAVTSTLAVFEQAVPGHSPLWPRAMESMTPQAREAYLYLRNRTNSVSLEDSRERVAAFRNELALEQQFVAAGGLLMAGADPTANGGVVPGFADLRGIELLVEAGFSVPAAIKIATFNGAAYLGLADRIGSIAPGKNADLVVLKGDPQREVTDLENVEMVFKDGTGYDSARLLNSVRGSYGEY